MEQIQAPWIGKGPEERERKTIAYCDNCSCDILEGEEYYRIDNIAICTDCIHEYLTIAETED